MCLFTLRILCAIQSSRDLLFLKTTWEISGERREGREGEKKRACPVSGETPGKI